MPFLDYRTWVVVCALCGCSVEDKGSTEGETSEGTSETGDTEPTSTTTTGETGETGDVEPTSTTTTGETGETGDTEPTSTTGEPSLLETCVFDPPCKYESGADIADPQMSYDAAMCAWTRLRDAAPTRVDLDVGGEESSLIPLGDAARAVLVVKLVGGDELVQRCTLAEAAFFQACIDGGPDQLGEGCAFGFGWYDGCADEPAPVCPEA